MHNCVLSLTFVNFFLLEDININLEVMNIDTIDILKQHMVHGRVLPGNPTNLRVLNPLISEQMWPSILVELLPFSDPPVVSIALNCSGATDSEVLRLLDSNEIEDLAIAVDWPLVVVWGSLENTLDYQFHV